MTEAIAAAAKALLKKLAVDLALDKDKRNKFLLIVGSIVVGLIFLLMTPIVVLSSIGGIEPPTVELEFNELDFLNSMDDEIRLKFDNIFNQGQAIEDAMTAADVRSQTIKAQLIYMSFLENVQYFDAESYANLFAIAPNGSDLIAAINSNYDLEINYEDFMRTYTFVMNATINPYMFSDVSKKNCADLAAWAENSIVPLISAKQRFKDYKVYGNNHMGLATNDQVLQDVVTFLKNGKSSLQGGYITQAKARKLLASTTPSYNYQLAFRGNMNMSAVSDDSEYNLILSKVNDSWFGIYDNSEEFRIDRMGNLNNQEMYICTYSNNKYTYTFESLEDQTVDFVFSNGEDSFVVAGIMLSEGTIVSVNTQNKTVTVDDTTYRFRNINPITLDENDISLKSKNVYNDTITDTIAARIKLTNLSDKEIDINDLEIVYLYDNDENTNEIFECDWAGLDNVTINSSVISNISYDEDLECS